MLDFAKLRKFVRTSIPFGVVESLRYRAHVAGATLTRGRKRLLRILLLSDHEVYTSEQQFAPLFAERAAFRRQLGVVFNHQHLPDALSLRALALQDYHFVGLKLGFRTPAEKALRIARAVRGALAPEAKLVYFDGDDDLGVQWPQLLPLVDLYVKKHCFRDRAEYRRARIGKTNLTDYAARIFGVSFAEDIIPASEPVDAAQLGKLVAGWNVGLDDKIRQLHARGAARAAGAKDIDVVCRATVSPDSWIYPLRAAVIPKIRALAPEARVLTPDERVSQEVYYQEMLRSRMCVSPFGYGEICWRDFEAVLCGCVLVKPDMSHVETEPDIFVPNETYVPVQWDFADLEITLRQLLAHPERCDQLRANASRVLRGYFERKAIVLSFEQILRRLGLSPAVLSAAPQEGA